MANLPMPDDLTSLVLRTDFSDDAKWYAVKAALDRLDTHRSATYVSDPAYTSVSVEALVEADPAAADDDKLTYVFLADATTMSDDEHRLLAVDLYGEPGRTFRVPLGYFTDVSTNLSIANLDFADFADFADATDETGTFRGFGS